MVDLSYINSKLSDALYILMAHEGDARERLAKAWPKIMVLSPSSFPSELKKDFDWVQKTMRRGAGVRVQSNSVQMPPINKLTGIRNSTASKVIKKIQFIQDKINNQVELEMGLDQS